MQSSVRNEATGAEGKPALGILPGLGQDRVEVSPSQAPWLTGGDRLQDIRWGAGHKAVDRAGHRVGQAGKNRIVIIQSQCWLLVDEVLKS